MLCVKGFTGKYKEPTRIISRRLFMCIFMGVINYSNPLK